MSNLRRKLAALGIIMAMLFGTQSVAFGHGPGKSCHHHGKGVPKHCKHHNGGGGGGGDDDNGGGDDAEDAG